MSAPVSSLRVRVCCADTRDRAQHTYWVKATRTE